MCRAICRVSKIKRGQVYAPHLATQPRDFSDLAYGNITGTDVDGYYDFGGELFVFIEAKPPGAALPRGQELALERLTDAIVDGGKCAITIVGEHTNCTGVIDMARLRVVRYRWDKKWRTPGADISVKDALDRVLDLCRRSKS